MWQRKQTVFLLLSAIVAVVALSVYFYSWVMFGLLLLAASVNIYTIFLFLRRPLQARLCVISMCCYVFWYVALIVYSKQVSPDASQFHLPWSSVLPMVSAILTAMARKGILADEKMVRAADRLR
jgi:hypothetical protein